MKKVFVIILLVLVGYFLTNTFSQITFGENRIGNPSEEKNVAAFYLNNTKEKTSVANVVTAIVVNYRGFDTLGEVTVLFLATTGLGSVLFRRKEDEHGVERIYKLSSSLVQTGSRILFPLIVLLGAYVFIHGHLTPGGGFQGGSIIASGFLLMLISYKNFHAGHNMLNWIESIAGITFVAIGILGLITGGSFLQNSLPAGNLNDLVSGGVIPIIYIAVGFKVAAELTSVLDIMLNIKPKK